MQHINTDHENSTNKDSHRSNKPTVLPNAFSSVASRLKHLFTNSKPMNTTFEQLVKSKADKHFIICISDDAGDGERRYVSDAIDIYADPPFALRGTFSKGKIKLIISWTAPNNSQLVREINIEDFQSADRPASYLLEWPMMMYLMHGDEADLTGPRCVGMFIEDESGRQLITTSFSGVMQLLEDLGGWFYDLYPMRNKGRRK